MTDEQPEQHKNDEKSLAIVPTDENAHGSVKTKVVSTPGGETAPPESHPITRADTVMLLLPGNDRPLIFKHPTNITLGRRDEAVSFSPTVDLTRYYGVMMGVSRRHAEIIPENDHFVVRDLNSANGTWLNERRLEPNLTYTLHNGDQLRLGQLLILVFLAASDATHTTGEAEAVQDSEIQMKNQPHITSLRLEDRENTKTERQGLTADYLNAVIAHYLKALNALQRTVREAQDQKAEPVLLRSMQCEPNGVELEIEHAHDILEFLYNKLPAFISEKAPHITDREELRRECANFLLEHLVFKFLAEKRADYIERIAAHLLDMEQSPLVIAEIYSHRPL